MISLWSFTQRRKPRFILMNPKEDVWDNLMRIKNEEVAAELLEIELGRKCTNQYP